MKTFDVAVKFAVRNIGGNYSAAFECIVELIYNFLKLWPEFEEA